MNKRAKSFYTRRLCHRVNNIKGLLTIPRYKGRRRPMVAQQVLWLIGELAGAAGEAVYNRCHIAAAGLHRRTWSDEDRARARGRGA